MIRRLSTDESGVVAALTALMLLVFVALTALVLDVGSLYVERRELQRTADLSALSGAQLLSEGTAPAEATAIEYVEKNHTRYHDVYSPADGDMVAAYAAGSGDCVVDGISYDCVETYVRVPDYEFYFGPIISVKNTSVAARAKAVLGNGAPGGDKLVPWVLMDCPDAYGEDRGYLDEQNAVVAAAVEAVNPSCPYEFSDDYNSGQVDMFLADAKGGNFQGADLSAEPDCPLVTGYFPKSGGAGGSDYGAFLSGNPDDGIDPCNIGPGARLHPESGQLTGPTKHGLNDRKVDDCMNEASFHEAVDVGVIGDGLVQIKEANPCLMALMLVVQTDPDSSSIKNDVPGNIKAMQHPDPDDANGDDKWRFADLSTGSSLPLIVRRFAFFYLTSRGTSGTPYRGLFLQAIDSEDAILAGPYDPSSGLFIIKLIE